MKQEFNLESLFFLISLFFWVSFKYFIFILFSVIPVSWHKTVFNILFYSQRIT